MQHLDGCFAFAYPRRQMQCAADIRADQNVRAAGPERRQFVIAQAVRQCGLADHVRARRAAALRVAGQGDELDAGDLAQQGIG